MYLLSTKILSPRTKILSFPVTICLKMWLTDEERSMRTRKWQIIYKIPSSSTRASRQLPNYIPGAGGNSSNGSHVGWCQGSIPRSLLVWKQMEATRIGWNHGRGGKLGGVSSGLRPGQAWEAIERGSGTGWADGKESSCSKEMRTVVTPQQGAGRLCRLKLEAAGGSGSPSGPGHGC